MNKAINLYSKFDKFDVCKQQHIGGKTNEICLIMLGDYRGYDHGNFGGE